MARHLLFEAGGIALAAPANHVHAVHEDLPVQPVAGTKKWFLGMAVAQGKLLPITDLSQFLGGTEASGRTLELAAHVGMSGLRVDRLFGLSDAEVSENKNEISGEDTPHDFNLTLTGQIVQENDRQHRMLDLAALIQSSMFVNIKESLS